MVVKTNQSELKVRTELWVLPNTLAPLKQDIEEEGEKPKEPCVLNSFYQSAWLTPEYRNLLESLDGIICESARGAKSILKEMKLVKSLYILPKKLTLKTANGILDELQGQKWGLVSDAGLVGVADPGAELIWSARQRNCRVEALPGASSIVQALCLSGLGCQRFNFEGYLPVDFAKKRTILNKLEMMSSRDERVILFMETPYRHEKIVHSCLDILSPTTLFSVVQNIGCQKQWVRSDRVSAWRSSSFTLESGPAIYLIKAAPKELNAL